VTKEGFHPLERGEKDAKKKGGSNILGKMGVTKVKERKKIEGKKKYRNYDSEGKE